MGNHTWHHKARQTKPDTGSTNKARQTMREKIKRHLAEDALLNEQAPAKRIKLIPKAGQIKTRSTIQGPPQKRRKTGAQKTQQTIALIQLFPELQQQENHNTEVLQNTNTRNHSAGTDIGTEHQPLQDNQTLEPTQQNWPIQETAKDVENTYQKTPIPKQDGKKYNEPYLTTGWKKPPEKNNAGRSTQGTHIQKN